MYLTLKVCADVHSRVCVCAPAVSLKVAHHQCKTCVLSPAQDESSCVCVCVSSQVCTVIFLFFAVPRQQVESVFKKSEE